jgi:uncharacterized protein
MLRLKRLGNDNLEAVESFLASRPDRAFALTSFVSHNRLESPKNRGTFYGWEDERGYLQAVALIGRFSMFESATPAALKEIARVARKHPHLHLLLGERKTVSEFWRHFDPMRKLLRDNSRYDLLKLEGFEHPGESFSLLRKAIPPDLNSIVAAHAQAFFEEHGVEPLDNGTKEFADRCLERILNGQTWIREENGEVVFKVEIMCKTSDLAYLEGIWLMPRMRKQGKGTLFLKDFCRIILKQSNTIYMLAESDNPGKTAFYTKAGFEKVGDYVASYLHSDLRE